MSRIDSHDPESGVSEVDAGSCDVFRAAETESLAGYVRVNMTLQAYSAIEVTEL